ASASRATDASHRLSLQPRLQPSAFSLSLQPSGFGLRASGFSLALALALSLSLSLRPPPQPRPSAIGFSQRLQLQPSPSASAIATIDTPAFSPQLQPSPSAIAGGRAGGFTVRETHNAQSQREVGATYKIQITRSIN